jgi:preprotein translocase subunit YajC
MNGIVAASSSGGGIQIIAMMVIFFGIFWFLAIRPQRKQQRAHREMVSMLKKGDEVVTIGGMFGTIKKIGPDFVELEIANRTKVRYLKRAISSIVSEEEEEYDDEPDEHVEDAEEEATDAEATEGDEDESAASDDDSETSRA